MSNQPENEQTEIITPEEVREYVLAEIDATKQAITELSEEELEEVAGGLFGFGSTGSTSGSGGLSSFSRIKDHFSAYGEHYLAGGQLVRSLYQTYQSRRPGPPAPEPPAPGR